MGARVTTGESDANSINDWIGPEGTFAFNPGPAWCRRIAQLGRNVTLTVKIDERVARALEELCRQAGETRTAAIRRLIQVYLAGQPRRSPAVVYDEVTRGRAPASDREPVSRDHRRFIKARLRARHGDR